MVRSSWGIVRCFVRISVCLRVVAHQFLDVLGTTYHAEVFCCVEDRGSDCLCRHCGVSGGRGDAQLRGRPCGRREMRN